MKHHPCTKSYFDSFNKRIIKNTLTFKVYPYASSKVLGRFAMEGCGHRLVTYSLTRHNTYEGSCTYIYVYIHTCILLSARKLMFAVLYILNTTNQTLSDKISPCPWWRDKTTVHGVEHVKGDSVKLRDSRHTPEWINVILPDTKGIRLLVCMSKPLETCHSIENNPP